MRGGGRGAKGRAGGRGGGEKQYCHVSAGLYLELLQTFSTMAMRKGEEVRRQQARYTVGLRKIDGTEASVKAMKEELGDEIGLALDCGPGLMPSDLLRLAKEFEPLHLMWMEDGPVPPTPHADADRCAHPC